jgi:hypothetical protein
MDFGGKRKRGGGKGVENKRRAKKKIKKMEKRKK